MASRRQVRAFVWGAWTALLFVTLLQLAEGCPISGGVDGYEAGELMLDF